VVVTGKKKGTCTVTVSAASGGATSQMLSVTVWNPGERKVVSVKSIEVTLSEAEIRTNDSYGDPITCRVTLTPVTDGETPTLEDLDYSIGSPSVLEVKDWNPTKGTFKLAAKTKSAASSTVTLFPVGKSASDPAAKKITIPIRKEIKEGIFVVQDDWKHIDSKGTFLLTAGETIDLSSSISPVTVQLKYYDDEIVKISEDGGDFALESTERYSTSTNGLKISVDSKCTSHYSNNYLTLTLDGIYLSGKTLKFDVYAEATGIDYAYAPCDENGNESGSYKTSSSDMIDVLAGKYYRLKAVVYPTGACQDVYWTIYPDDIKWQDNTPVFYLPGGRTFTFKAKTRGTATEEKQVKVG